MHLVFVGGNSIHLGHVFAHLWNVRAIECQIICVKNLSRVDFFGLFGKLYGLLNI